ncbi:MAG: hypothetical protein J5772_03360 [Clostridia bacterium]|nr:hypothetical protein [Clostridia bacterium]
MNRYDHYRSILALMLVLIMALSLFGCTPKQTPADPTDAPARETETARPTETAEATGDADEEWQTVELRSRRAELFDSAMAVLEGSMKADEIEPCTDYNGGIMCGECFLRRGTEEGEDGFYAYDLCLSMRRQKDGKYETRYECAEPFACFPAETLELAEASLADHTKAYLGLDVIFQEGDGIMPMRGYAGSDWFLLMNSETTQGKNVHTIWRTDDGESFYEFGHNNDFIGVVTGACILSGTTGFLCQTEMRSQYSWFRVFGTFDGGATWQDMGLEIPKEREGCPLLYSTAFAPTFIGDRGVVFVSAVYEDGSEFGFSTTYGFISSDGGRTWTLSE